MTLIPHPFSTANDLRAMTELVQRFPTDNIHIIDLPYRLSSWALDHAENSCLWRDAAGTLLGWAVLQTPFWTIDYAHHPQAEASLHRQILAWADRRAQEIRHAPAGHPAWYVNVFSDQTERIHDLEALGFASQANVGDNSWSQVLLQHPGELPTSAGSLPTGFSVRFLNGEAEIAAYVELHRAAFNSKNMTLEWRQRIIHSPDYTPELDVVVVAPDGRLAAFCVGWLARDPAPAGKIHGQIEPLGVHPDFRRLGLGRAVLLECLRHMQRLGAEHFYVQTDNYRDAAFGLYTAAGFRVAKDVWMFRRDYPENE